MQFKRNIFCDPLNGTQLQLVSNRFTVYLYFVRYSNILYFSQIHFLFILNQINVDGFVSCQQEVFFFILSERDCAVMSDPFSCKHVF